MCNWTHISSCIPGFNKSLPLKPLCLKAFIVAWMPILVKVAASKEKAIVGIKPGKLRSNWIKFKMKASRFECFESKFWMIEGAWARNRVGSKRGGRIGIKIEIGKIPEDEEMGFILSFSISLLWDSESNLRLDYDPTSIASVWDAVDVDGKKDLADLLSILLLLLSLHLSIYQNVYQHLYKSISLFLDSSPFIQTSIQFNPRSPDWNSIPISIWQEDRNHIRRSTTSSSFFFGYNVSGRFFSRSSSYQQFKYQKWWWWKVTDIRSLSGQCE